MAYRAPREADLRDLSLTEGQIFLLFQGALHDLLIAPPVRLGPETVDRGALAPVEQAVLDAGRVGGPGHLAPQGVQLPDQVPLAGAADGRVAGHVAHRVQVDGEADGPAAQARRSKGGLDPRVASADYRDIILSG